jgi:hypothetical protein
MLGRTRKAENKLLGLQEKHGRVAFLTVATNNLQGAHVPSEAGLHHFEVNTNAQVPLLPQTLTKTFSTGQARQSLLDDCLLFAVQLVVDDCGILEENGKASGSPIAIHSSSNLVIDFQFSLYLTRRAELPLGGGSLYANWPYPA